MIGFQQRDRVTLRPASPTARWVAAVLRFFAVCACLLAEGRGFDRAMCLRSVPDDGTVPAVVGARPVPNRARQRQIMLDVQLRAD